MSSADCPAQRKIKTGSSSETGTGGSGRRVRGRFGPGPGRCPIQHEPSRTLRNWRSISRVLEQLYKITLTVVISLLRPWQ